MTELVSYLEPWETRDAVLAGVSLAPFPPWLSIDAWKAFGSWQPRKAPDELITFCAFTVSIITCNARERGRLVIYS